MFSMAAAGAGVAVNGNAKKEHYEHDGNPEFFFNPAPLAFLGDDDNKVQHEE
jgi:hypothetical protein